MDKKQALDSLKRAKGALLDWDGCVAFGNQPSPAAIEFISEWTSRVAIVSNNSTLLPEDLVRALRNADVHIPASRIILAGVEAVKRAKNARAARVLMLADARMKAFARNLELRLVKDDADVVILLRDTRINYARLEAACNCVRRGAKLIVANPDKSHPGLKGRLIPETGALLEAILACVGQRDVDYEVIGKPNARLFLSACQSLSLPPADVVMIGDNPDTDIAGSRACGIPGVLIGPHAEVAFEDLLTPPRLQARVGTS